MAYPMAVTGRAHRQAITATLLVSLACDPSSAPGAKSEPPEPEPSAEASSPSQPRDRSATPDPSPTAEPPAALPAPAEPTAAAPPTEPDPTQAQAQAQAPLERRRAGRALMVYVEPRLGTAFRGKIPRGQVFELYEHVPGQECGGEGWGRIDVAAYACLQHTEPVEDEAVVLPATLADGLAPFFYARLRPKDQSGQNPPAPRWRSRRAMLAKAPPEGMLEPEHDYAFVERRRVRGGAVLATADRRVVRERDVKRMKPSELAGRDVIERPIPAGTVALWSIEWPHAIVRAEPHPDAAPLDRLPLHAEGLARDEPSTGAAPNAGDDAWVRVTEPTAGWVLAEQVRRWVELPPPPGTGDDEVWLDVDLEQQMLALRRGPALEFLTLVSSGNWKHATPLGLYRIEGKWAFADMRSRAGDDDTYHVEGVPWVMYFRGRYALHGTFWHNRFGRRTSHGCINLSAHDARVVYERTTPVAKPGWLVINEHAQEPGTVLRIRKGTAAPRDRRRPPTGT